VDAQRGQVRVAFRLNREPEPEWQRHFNNAMREVDGLAEPRRVRFHGSTLSTEMTPAEIEDVFTRFRMATEMANAAYRNDNTGSIRLQERRRTPGPAAAPN
jgi:hypothetical protein